MTARTRAAVEHRFFDGQYAVHLMVDGAVALPQLVELIEPPDEGASLTDPWLVLPGEALHALYEAIGVALGKHTCDNGVLTEALRIERQRVAKLLDHVVGQVDA
jgi:hypothetical protein